MKIGVLIVAYNAEWTIETVLDRVPTDFGSEIAEILVLDDHSTDRTTRVAEAYRDLHPDLPVTVIRHAQNLGYGGNQKAGYQYAADHGWDVAVMLHGDGQYAPEMLPDMVRPFVDPSVDAVFGSRMMSDKHAPTHATRRALKGGMPLYKYVGNRVLTATQNRLVGTHLTEWHSGYRAYRVATLTALELETNSDGFDFDTEIILQLVARGHRIVEIPIQTHYGDEICHVNGFAYARDIVVHSARFRLGNRGFGTGSLGQADEYSYKPSPRSSHGRVLQMMEGRAPCRVLDVGCGPGWLAQELRKRGHSVVGIDIMEHPAVRARTDSFVQADLDQGLPDEAAGVYDVVIAADVIEHVRSPEQLVRQMAEWLSPDGRLLASVPNISHWYSRGRIALGLFNYDQRGILDRTHLRFFTRRSFLQLVRRCHLTPAATNHTGIPFDVLMSSTDSVVVRAAARVDEALLWVRPTLFAYQFVFELVPVRPSTAAVIAQ